MAKQLDKPIEKAKVSVESTVSEPIATGKYVDPGKKATIEEIDDDELDLELDDDDNEAPDETGKTEKVVAKEIDDDDDEDEQEPPKVEPAKPQTKEQRKIQALKNEASKLQREKAELQRKLEEKTQADSESALAKKYVEDGYDEKEAKSKAKADTRQDTIEKQLEMLMFEKKNRRTLEMYPDYDMDLDRIMLAVKTSGMTTEQVCRGLYGDSKEIERERRMVKAITSTGSDDSRQNTSVAKAMRTAEQPKKSSLTQDQLRAKRILEKTVNKGKPITDEDFLKCWQT